MTLTRAKINGRSAWLAGMLMGLAGLVTTAAAADGKWDVEWTADNLPQDSHPVWQYFGGGEITAKDDALVVASEVDISTAGFRLIPDEQIWNPQSAKSVELEVALKVVSQDGDYANLLNLWGFGPDGEKYWNIKFQAAGIQVNGDPVAACDMGEFRTFRIVATAKRLEIFAAGSRDPLVVSEAPLAVQNDPGAEGLNTVDFGDTSGTAGGVVEWQFLRWRTDR